MISGVGVSLASTGGPDQRSYRVSFERYGELAPDHQPEIDLRTAVEDLVEGLQGMGFDNPEFRASPLIRLVVLKSLRERGLIDEQLVWTNQTHSSSSAQVPVRSVGPT